MSPSPSAALDRCPMFAPLPPEERNELAAATEVLELDRGEAIFHQGDAGDRVFLVDSGQVKLSQLTAQGDEVILGILGPGDLFAVAVAMQSTKYPATAWTMEPSRVLAWRAEQLADVMTRFPAVSFEATRVISARVRRLQDRFRELATLPVPARLAREVLRLAEDHGIAGRDGSIRIALRLSRQDLAELTGTTLYTVSRLLTAWQEEGVVAVGRQRVEIEDPAALRALAAE